MLQKCFGESTLSITQVFEWHKGFSEGREVVENLPHASRPSTSVNDGNIEKLKKIVLENRFSFMFWIWSASLPDLWADYSWIFHHDNVLSHLAKHKTKVIVQPPYSPDLAPCDFFLFPKLKYPLRRTRHESIEAIKRNLLKELKSILAEAYKKCMENWINRWHGCIVSKGAYFEGDDKDLY